MSNPFIHEPRRRFTPQERARFFAAAGSRCSVCTRKLGPSDDWDLDHTVALANGGTNDDGNIRVVCCWCHTDKTSEDVTEHAKGRRAYTKAVVPTRFKRSKSWGRR